MTLEQTQRRRKAVGTIHDIVSAMRAIAAGRIQNAQGALTSARRFQEIVQKAIVGLTKNLADLSLPNVAGRPAVLMVMTSEQPLCGAFNQNVLDLAEKRWRELNAQGPVHLVVVGRRGVRQIAARRIAADRAESAATSLAGLRDLAKRLATLVDERFATGKLGPLYVIYSRYQSISDQVPTEERILPLDLKSMRQVTSAPKAPFYRYVETPDLLAGLISEYAFISLYRIAADSHASEQASRLLAMDGATRNTEKMLTSLFDLERRERQGEITRQVLELIAARFNAGEV